MRKPPPECSTVAPTALPASLWMTTIITTWSLTGALTSKRAGIKSSTQLLPRFSLPILSATTVSYLELLTGAFVIIFSF